MPILDNKTKAIEVVSFNKVDPPSEGFFLILRNVSRKGITAVDLYMPEPDGSLGQGQQSRGYKANPVMSPGGVFTQHVNFSHSSQMTPTGLVPTPAYERMLIIRTVVFADGTYDGLVEPAAEIAAEHRGMNIQRRQIIRLLDQQGKSGGPLQSVDAFKETVSTLSLIPHESAVNKVLTHFPSLNNTSKPLLSQKVGWGLLLARQEFQHIISYLEETRKQSGKQISFAKWLKQMKVVYEELVSR